MSYNLGINLVEVDGATPSIQGAPTSVAGFLVRTQRGVPGMVVQVSNFSQFTDAFGSFYSKGTTTVANTPTQTDYVGAYALKGFFDNGGSLAYVWRITNGTGTAASATFNNANATPSVALTITAASRGQSDPGLWGNSIGITITNSKTNVAGAFDIAVTQKITNGNGTILYRLLETWSTLVIGGAPGGQNPLTVINDPQVGSKYIMVAVTGTAPPAPTTGATPTMLVNGADDTMAQAAIDTAATNFFNSPCLFDGTPIELLACPESTASTLVAAMKTYCGVTRGDCMFVGHVPDPDGQSAAKTYGQPFQEDKVYGALYWPYIQIADPNGSTVFVPPTGHVLGVYARTDQQRGIWKAPAGDGAVVQGAIGVRTAINDTDFTDLVKNGCVNAIRPIPGSGIIVDSSRTLSTNTLWLYVNVRLLFNYVKTSLKLGLKWVVQEPNDSTLWNKIKFGSINPFLMNLWRQGAFGSGKPSDTFTIKVDSVNNPPANIVLGLLNIEVYFFPSRPAETIVITVGQQQGGGSSAGES